MCIILIYFASCNPYLSLMSLTDAERVSVDKMHTLTAGQSPPIRKRYTDIIIKFCPASACNRVPASYAG